MYIWKLARINPDLVDYDQMREVVVIAETENGARHLAGESAGDEGWRTWLDSDQTACIAIGESLGHLEMSTKPGVICRGFHGREENPHATGRDEWVAEQNQRYSNRSNS